MTEPGTAQAGASDPDVQLSDSGGTMTRLTGRATARPVDLAVLEPLRVAESDGPWQAAGSAPFLPPGDVVLWRYGRGADPMRVVSDDARGLVAWLPSGSEMLAFVPADGRQLRDRPVAERFSGERVPVLRTWRGGGILRAAPTGRPWSVWYFWDEGGALEGHYVNLELPHRRSTAQSGTRETNTRDLVLDVWLEPDGELWLKDADELEAAVAAGKLTAGMADEVQAVGELARAELVEQRSWPFDQHLDAWRPPAGWDEPLRLPDTALVRAARERRPVAAGRPS